MKIIDILNKKANGTLEDGFSFKYDSLIYTYNKTEDKIIEMKHGEQLGENVIIELTLNEEVEVIEENKEIEELWANCVGDSIQCRDDFMIKNRDKINELVRAVNKLTKESK